MNRSPARPSQALTLAALAALALASTGCVKSNLKWCGPPSPADCPSGFVCLAQHCHPLACGSKTCRTGEFCQDNVCLSNDCYDKNNALITCSSGQMCVAGGKCLPTSCGSTACPSGQVCDGSTCVDPLCAGKTCSSSQTCAAGTCMSKNCASGSCDSGQVCSAGTCTDVDCVGVTCAAGQICKKGQCAACAAGDPGCTCGSKTCTSTQTCIDTTCQPLSCDTEACRKGEYCANGVCTEITCADKTCDAGSHCADGQCQSSTCGSQTCGAREACVSGQCVDELCVSVKCDSGQACAGGQCYATTCPKAAAPCPTGMVCDNTGHCADSGCMGASCPTGKFCAGGSCVDCPTGQNCNCSAAVCSSFQMCLAGQCRDPNCADQACRTGEWCVDGSCVTPQCAGVACPGQQCLQGRCQTATCGTTTCSGRLVCDPATTTCVDPTCVGVSCDATQTCAGGQCLPKDCPGAKCPTGTACVNGRCSDTSCVGARCPSGSYCVAGACKACLSGAETSCTDGIDENCNQLIDCSDPSCDGKGCSDGNVCNTGGKCKNGICQGGTPKGCNSPPDCHLGPGYCDPADGKCKYVAGATGATCGAPGACTEMLCSARGVCGSTSLPDDTNCGNGQACQGGTCTSSAGRNCIIGAQQIQAGSPNPGNPCQFCSPTLDASNWSNRPSGSCGVGGICSGGTCQQAGCVIGGAYFASGTKETGNPCASCDPSKSTDNWTVSGANTSCGAAKVCIGGTCQSGCLIAGVAYEAGVANPSNPCQSCRPASNATAWSNSSEGATCAAGRVCSGGTCKDGCYIDAAHFATGASNPNNECQKCQPAQSTIGWTANDGASCANGVCSNGQCQAGCIIDGKAYLDGDPNPQNACQACKPDKSSSGWTNSDGTGCGSGLSCQDGKCGPGCTLNGQHYDTGQTFQGNPCMICDPSQNPSGPSSPPEGTGCPGGTCKNMICQNGCTIDGTVYPDKSPNKDDPCYACDSTRSTTDWSPCGTHTACWSGDETQGQRRCMPGCVITGSDKVAHYYQFNTVNSTNPCLICDINTDNYHWTVQEGLDCGTPDSCRKYWDWDTIGWWWADCERGCGINTDGSLHFFAPDTLASSTSCLACKPDATTRNWTRLGNGTVCAFDSGFFSFQYGVCNNSDDCANGCSIGGKFYSNGAVNPGDNTKCCVPTDSADSVTGWSDCP